MTKIARIFEGLRDAGLFLIAVAYTAVGIVAFLIFFAALFVLARFVFSLFF